MHVAVKELVPGMKVGRDIESGGRKLLSEGAVLTASLIHTLVVRGIKFVDIANEMAGVAPGSDVHYAHNADFRESAAFLAERERLDRLFSTVGDDEQMLLLKYCIWRQAEEGLHAP